MKAKKLPASLGDKWRTWPTLDELHERNRAHKLHAVRALLAPVPCYRCEDNSVRYDPELAELAIAGRLDVESDEDEPSLGADLSTELGSGKLIDAMMLFRELARMVGDARREKNETIKAMETPLKTGVAMMERAMELMAKRLEHYDEMWDGLVLTSERLASQQADRDVATLKQSQSVEMRKDVFGLVKDQFPRMMQNFQLAIEGRTALELVRSFEGPIIDTMLEHDVFTAEQKAMIARLRQPAKQAPQKPEAQQSENHGPS